MVVSLPDSKSAKRKGAGEQVTIYDPLVLQHAAEVFRGTKPGEFVYRGKWEVQCGAPAEHS